MHITEAEQRVVEGVAFDQRHALGIAAHRHILCQTFDRLHAGNRRQGVWVLWSWQPARLKALATAAATPNRGRKCERAGEAMAKLLRGSVSKGATLVSAVKRRKRELWPGVKSWDLRKLMWEGARLSHIRHQDYLCGLRAMALLELLFAAAWARIVAANILQGVAHRFLVGVAAVRAVDMTMVVIMVIVIVVAVRTVDMGLLSHRCCSGIKSPGIISPLWATCTS